MILLIKSSVASIPVLCLRCGYKAKTRQCNEFLPEQPAWTYQMPDEGSGYQNIGERRAHEPQDTDNLELPELIKLWNDPNGDATAKPTTCQA